MSENNDTSNESNSVGSDTVSLLQVSRRPGGGLGGFRVGVLRPSVLGSSILSSSTLATTAAAVVSDCSAVHDDTASNTKTEDELSSCNPFLKDQKDIKGEEDDKVGAVGGEMPNSKENLDKTDKKKHDDDDDTDERPDPLTLLRKNGIERANLFAAAKNSIPRVEKSGFVFGQNVHERVVGENINPESATQPQNPDAGMTSGELLFSSVIQNAAKSNDLDNNIVNTNNKETDVKSLTDVAREYEESRAQKRKYEEVATFTGEENEVNIVDVNCKLFAFVNSNWEERGRGSLRLNDSKNEQECSRVVFRTSGNLRLLLNTKVWAGMVAERSSQKSLRLTAMDNTGKIKIFLAMARPVDINQLHKALVERIDLRKAAYPEECQSAAAAENNGEESKNGDIAILNADDTEDVEVAHVHMGAAKTTSIAGTEPTDPTEPSLKKSLMISTKAAN